MSALLAAEGGYQSFELGGGEWFWLIFSAVTALIALAVGFYLVRAVNAADTGTDKMREIAAAIQEGAMAYLKRQFRTIAIIVIPLAIIVFLTSTEVVKPTTPWATSAGSASSSPASSGPSPSSPAASCPASPASSA